MTLTLTVNGEPRTLDLPPQTTLLELLRERLGLIGAKEGCDDGECGACTVLLDGAPVNACILLAAQAGGRAVTTVEGVHGAGGPGDAHPLQRALVEHGAIQCGFCTPGIVMAALAAVAEPDAPASGTPARPAPTEPVATEPAIRRALAGNLCRCTGYQKVVPAVMAWADENHHQRKNRGPSA
ncbi:MAG TPA: (2Fe-2S)-binding protein [Conexibacter sp.]|nr:(2Fe-2S)-binding protein [Conexibacter sp.]